MKTSAIIPFYYLTNNFDDDVLTLNKDIQILNDYVDIVIVVDDGTNVPEKGDAIFVHHDKNYGKTKSILTGIAKSLENSVDYIIECDADNDHDLNEGYKFIEKFKDNLHSDYLVIGDRYFAPSMGSEYRDAINSLQSKFFSLFGINLRDSVSGFRGYTSDLAQIFQYAKSNNWGIATEEIILAFLYGAKIESIQLDHSKPRKNSTKADKLSSVLNGILAHSNELRSYGHEKDISFLQNICDKMESKEEFTLESKRLGIEKIRFVIENEEYTIKIV